MQFQVPQFTEIEDKIFGPLTLKQFIFVLGGGGSVFVLWSLLPHWLAIILGIPVGGFFLALAFYQVNGQSLLTVLTNAIGFSSGARLYTWQKSEKRAAAAPKEVIPPKAVPTTALTEGKLKELSWSLDIHKKVR